MERKLEGEPRPQQTEEFECKVCLKKFEADPCTTCPDMCEECFRSLHSHGCDCAREEVIRGGTLG